MSLHSVLVLIREPGNKASPGIVVCTGAHQGSLGTRLALGLYTAHWCSPREPGMRLAQGLYSVMLLTRGAGEPGYITLGLYSAVVLTRGAWERA